MIKKLQITSITKDRVIDDNEDFLKVCFDLIDENDQVVESLSHGFPFGTNKTFIESELQKFLEMRLGEQTVAIENAEHEEALKQADETIAELTKNGTFEAAPELVEKHEEVVAIAREKSEKKDSESVGVEAKSHETRND